MTKFEILFGIKEFDVKKNCILMPLLTKDVLKNFAIEKLVNGRIYSSGNSNDFTLIRTGMCPGFVGDVVLHLKDTPCKNLILFGSCGLAAPLKDLDIGTLVTPFECYSNESFSTMLLSREHESNIFYPDKNLLDSFLNTDRNSEIKKVICSTISSLRLEEDRIESIIKSGIEVLDMECSAFFSAASYTGLNAITLFFISDIVGVKPFYMNSDLIHKTKLDSSIKKAIDILCMFIKTNLNN
ncbi:hypothetical protein HZA55_04570 [Candidatus Poribacteria bacterium]|nr:hypothetical protein [Candidatus Poribacteria bacterium]